MLAAPVECGPEAYLARSSDRTTKFLTISVPSRASFEALASHLG